MTILNARYADAANTVVLINTSTDGDVYVQDTANVDDPFAVALAAWVATGGQIEPFVPTPVPPPVPPPELSREAFCVALISAGILTEAEATEAALGTWPAKFEPALGGKSLIEKLTIKNIWRETKTVARDAPLFLDLLEFYSSIRSLTVEQKEQLRDLIFSSSII